MFNTKRGREQINNDIERLHLLTISFQIFGFVWHNNDIELEEKVCPRFQSALKTNIEKSKSQKNRETDGLSTSAHMTFSNTKKCKMMGTHKVVDNEAQIWALSLSLSLSLTFVFVCVNCQVKFQSASIKRIPVNPTHWAGPSMSRHLFPFSTILTKNQQKKHNHVCFEH